MTKKRFYIVSGFSGSGKTVALRCFEEAGFFCVDNLPGELLIPFATLCLANKNIKKVAVVLDARGKDFMASVGADIVRLRERFLVTVIFLKASLPTITKRFKESRLRHPLSLTGTITEGFKLERRLLEIFEQQANLVTDTSQTTIHELKTQIQNFISQTERGVFEIHMLSFGYKFGLPLEADSVIDVRFLKNPYFVDRLRSKGGLTRAVQDYIFKDKKTKVFYKKTVSYLCHFIKQYRTDGKSSVTIALGCTGGKHRSIALVERLKRDLGLRLKCPVRVFHRDIGRE